MTDIDFLDVEDEQLYDAMIAIAERRMDKLQLAHLLRQLGTVGGSVPNQDD